MHIISGMRICILICLLIVRVMARTRIVPIIAIVIII